MGIVTLIVRGGDGLPLCGTMDAWTHNRNLQKALDKAISLSKGSSQDAAFSAVPMAGRTCVYIFMVMLRHLGVGGR